MFASLAQGAGVNELVHHREPASAYDQRVIRQNRDTLYSSAIVDIAQGATLSIPDVGDRYLSVMVVNNDHYINDVLHTAGEHPLTVDRFDTDYVPVAARILVDPNDTDDLDAVHALQEQSISVYNRDGFFESNDRNAYSVNNITAAANADGSITVHFGGCADDRPNCLPIMEGWNYTVRMYRP
jgi:hypothetical protein